MASVFGHAISIIGFRKFMPDNRISKKMLTLGVVSSILPDIDVIGYRFGIAEFTEYGYLAHRGFTHSIIFAALWSIVLISVFHFK